MGRKHAHMYPVVHSPGVEVLIVLPYGRIALQGAQKLTLVPCMLECWLKELKVSGLVCTQALGSKFLRDEQPLPSLLSRTSPSTYP